MGTSIAALLLADARLPAGGHAHSAQVEPAVTAGLVLDVTTLTAFLRGRLWHAALTPASFAVAAFAVVAAGTSVEESLVLLDAELDARLPSPAQRTASRAQGRTLLRAATPAWPSAALAIVAATDGGPHHAIALGVVCASAGCSAEETARVCVYQQTTNGATAGVRLLGLDPLAVNAALAELAPEMETVAASAAQHTTTRPRDLPAVSAPVLDLLAGDHATWEVRLFAS